MVHTSDARRRYVLGDWGASRLRLFLVEGEEIADRRDGPGVGVSKASPADTLAALISPWIDAARGIDVLLSGMVGSRNGLFEAPYATLPADSAAWLRAAGRTRLPGMNITIATGLRSAGQSGADDVMRGEETQIFGAMQLDPALGAGNSVLVLPGTHSKWVEVQDGAVVRFRTALTGEVYALLRDHSTLLRAGRDSDDQDSSEEMETGFIAGVRRCSHLAEGLLAALFEARTAQLLEHRSHAWASGFLSGLLIASEVATLGAAYACGCDVRIIGDPKLASLYQRVLADYEVATHTLDGAACAIAGLRYLRRYSERL